MKKRRGGNRHFLRTKKCMTCGRFFSGRPHQWGSHKCICRNCKRAFTRYRLVRQPPPAPPKPKKGLFAWLFG